MFPTTYLNMSTNSGCYTSLFICYTTNISTQYK